MLFSSMEFLFVFLPIVLIGNFLLPKMYRNAWLMLCSIAFYAWGEPTFIIFMLASIVFNYMMALNIQDQTDSKSPNAQRNKKIYLAITVVGNLAVLGIYKYANFVTANLRAIFPALQPMIPQTKYVLPIGISFFTFQAMSYVIDVYRGHKAQRNPINIALYISLFPQLVAGPIVRYSTIEEQMQERTITFDDFYTGIYRFLVGFNKKMLLSNVMAEVADAVFALESHSVLMAWVGALCYSLQIFYDFSGYSDMAIGLGRMLGFHFLENFDYPYCSGSITEFWRRWHISLGTWFRDYVYFPLGGSRVSSKLRLVMNLAVVWFLTGLWHGANWTFLMWGCLYGVIIVVEKLLNLPKRYKEHAWSNVLGHVITLLAVIFGWVLFRANTIDYAGGYIQSMLHLNGNALLDAEALRFLREYSVTIIVGLVCSTPVLKLLGEKLRGSKNGLVAGGSTLVMIIWQLVLFMVSVSFLVLQSHNPFIYFNF